MRRFLPILALALLVARPARAETPAERLDALADRFVAQMVAFEPVAGEYAGLPVAHDRFLDPRPPALAAWVAQERADLAELDAIDRGALPAASQAPFAILKEQLEADLQMRVCRTELWT